jgi:hypothetical protein
LAVDKVGGEVRQPIEPIVRPALFDHNVLSLGKTLFVQALPQRCDKCAETARPACCEESRLPAAPAAALAPLLATPLRPPAGR